MTPSPHSIARSHLAQIFLPSLRVGDSLLHCRYCRGPIAAKLSSEDAAGVDPNEVRGPVGRNLVCAARS